MLVRSAMSQDNASITPAATVLEAASLMVNSGETALPVVEEGGNLVGIISEADVISHLASASPSAGHRVSDVMTKEAIFVDESATLKDAIDLMLSKRLRVMPVCRVRIVVGMLDRSKIMRLIVSQAVGDPVSMTSTQDDDLRREVVSAVKGHRWALAQRFDVVVKDGAVHLWGVVPNDTVHAAYREAVEGIAKAKSVVSHMHVMPHGMRMTNMY